jgi:hypothetical protein
MHDEQEDCQVAEFARIQSVRSDLTCSILANPASGRTCNLLGDIALVTAAAVAAGGLRQRSGAEDLAS